MSWLVTFWNNKHTYCCTYESILTLGWGFFIGRHSERGNDGLADLAMRSIWLVLEMGRVKKAAETAAFFDHQIGWVR